MRLYFVTYDNMIDHLAKSYGEFCHRLDIPNIYESSDDFRRRYPFDETDCNSMISNLLRAYDNAIVLREEIGSEALSYIQLSVYEMRKAEHSEAPMMEFQRILDNLMAFCGVCDDQIASENVRNILKIGKRVERIDLYGRLHRSQEDLYREVCRLTGRVQRCNLKYNEKVLIHLAELVNSETLDYGKIVNEIENFLL